MTTGYTRQDLLDQLQNYTFDRGQPPELTDELVSWLCKLYLLKDLPYNYLLPDEDMLPAESIRFFYVDGNWQNALVDGAFSIGRNLSADTGTAQAFNFDAQVLPFVMNQLYTKLLRSPATIPISISGFILKSQVVRQCPAMGVNAYDTTTTEGAIPLKILRMQRLGSSSDTLLVMAAGNIQTVQIHEPAQVLHYGVDSFTSKNVLTYSCSPEGNTNNISVSSYTSTPVDISACFRSNAPRTFNMTALAEALAGPSGLGDALDSAQMGFVMTQGVGMVSFNLNN